MNVVIGIAGDKKENIERLAKELEFYCDYTRWDGKGDMPPGRVILPFVTSELVAEFVREKGCLVHVIDRPERLVIEPQRGECQLFWHDKASADQYFASQDRIAAAVGRKLALS